MSFSICFLILLPKNVFSAFLVEPSMLISIKIQTRAVEPQPEPKQFWVAGASVKKFQMVKLEPEIRVPVQQT